MPAIMRIPNTSSSKTIFTLGDNTFKLNFRFISIDQSWKMDIYDINDNPILTGVGIKPLRNITGKYLLGKVLGGDIWCIPVTNTTETLTRDNINTDYQLWFYKNNETPPINL